MKLTLRQKLTVSLLSMAVVPTIVLFFVNSSMMKSAIFASHEERAKADTDMIVSRNLKNLEQVALNYAKFLSIDATVVQAAYYATALGSTADLQALLQKVKEELGLSFVEFTDLRGNVLSSTLPNRKGALVDQSTIISESERKGGHVEFALIAEEKLFQIHAGAILNRGGASLGVIHAGYRLDGSFLNTIVSDVQLSLFLPDSNLSASSGQVAVDPTLVRDVYQRAEEACRNQPQGEDCRNLQSSSEQQTIDGTPYFVMATPLRMSTQMPVATLVLAKAASQLKSDLNKARSVSLLVTFLCALASTGVGFMLAQRMVLRIKQVVDLTREVSNGRLQERVTVQSGDELGDMASSVNVLAEQLHRMIKEIAGVISDVEAETANLVGTATQQSALAAQQSAAITETSATTAEIAQTSSQATGYADSVIGLAQKSDDLSNTGKSAVEEATSGMELLGEQVNAMALSITELAERMAQIGEINGTVKELAEQSNLLALNASIEAAKAGEHGRGFSVVAAEMRSLAEQSKAASGQVKTIITELQTGIRKSVGVTEEGSKRAYATVALARSAAEAITGLTEVNRDSTLAARQIANNTRQQTIGVDQIVSAIAEASSAMNENLEGTRRVEQVAARLTGLSKRLGELVSRYDV